MMTGSNIYQNNPRDSETPKAITVGSFIWIKTNSSGREARSIFTNVARRKQFGARAESVGRLV